MLRLVVLGDAHFSRFETRRSNLLLQHSPTLLETALKQIAENPRRPDYLIQIGDLIDGADLTADLRKADLREAVELIDAAGLPWTWIPGNHDVESFDGDRRVLLPSLRRERSYGEMTLDGNEFLLLDSCLPTIHGQIDPEQQAWLEASLDRHRADRVFVVLHHVFNWSVEDDMYIENGDRIEALFVNARAVKAVFMGHCHTNRVDTIDGLHEIATGALCSWPLLFRWVEIYEDRLQTWMEKIDVSAEIHEEARRAIEERPRPWPDQMGASMTLELR